MNVRNVKRFIGIFVLAFLITFVIIIINLPTSENDVVDESIVSAESEKEQIHIVSDEPIESEPEEEESEPEPEREKLDSVVLYEEEMPDNLKKIADDYNVIGMSLVVIKNGEVAHCYSYGYQDRENEIKFTSNSVMRVAAVSEMVSAIGIMSLCEQGLASLDDPVGNSLGYTVINPKVDKEITLRQIMTHTAGISDYGAYNKVVNGEIEYQSLREMLNGTYAKNSFYEANPGRSYDFSNFGAAVLGCVIATVKAESFNDYMIETVFSPLSIDAAYLSTSISEKSNIAAIYRQNKLNYSVAEMDETSAEYAQIPDRDNYRLSHGNLYISTAGLSRLMRMFLGGGTVDGVKILEPSSVSAMISTAAEGSLYKDVGYGLCTAVKNDLVTGRTLYGHGGAAYGGTAEFFFDPTDDSGVILICNGSINTTDDSGFSNMGKAFIREVYGTVID